MYGVDILTGDAETDHIVRVMLAATVRISTRSAEFLLDMLGEKKYREITDMFIEINRKTGLVPCIEYADMEEVSIGLYSPFDIYEYEPDGTKVNYMVDLSYQLIEDFVNRRWIDGMSLSHYAPAVLNVYADNEYERLFGDEEYYMDNPVAVVLEELMDFLSERYEYHLESAVDDLSFENIRNLYMKALKEGIYGIVSVYPDYIIENVCGIKTRDCIMNMDDDNIKVIDSELARIIENMLELVKSMNSRGLRCDITTLPGKDAACVAITQMHDLKRVRAFVIEGICDNKPAVFSNMLVAGMYICTDGE